MSDKKKILSTIAKVVTEVCLGLLVIWSCCTTSIVCSLLDHDDYCSCTVCSAFYEARHEHKDNCDCGLTRWDCPNLEK